MRIIKTCSIDGCSNKNYARKFCSKHYNKLVRTSIPKYFCINCGKETCNKKYCSHSCSAKVNNTLSKRKLTKLCKKCNEPIRSNRTYCLLCFGEKLKVSCKDYILGEIIYVKHHTSSAYALVRSRARLALPLCPCQKCGYEKHTEVCHIRPIRSFSLETKLSTINNEHNLIRLCPNCHWENDNPS